MRGVVLRPDGRVPHGPGAHASPPFDLAHLKFTEIGVLVSNSGGFYSRSALPRWTFLLALSPEHSPLLDQLRFEVAEHSGSDEVEVTASIRSRTDDAPPAPEIEWWAERLADLQKAVQRPSAEAVHRV